VVGALSESPTPRKYWNDLKRKIVLEAGDNELSAGIGQLALHANDAAMRLVDRRLLPSTRR